MNNTVMEAPYAAENGKRILLVDDEIMIGSLTSEMLVDIGYSVTTESDSRSALQLFLQQPDDFDLIITDLSMPVLSGVDLVAEIRKQGSDIPVIFCTGFLHNLNSEDFLSLGVSAVCSKPFDFSVLTNAIDHALAE